MEHQVFLGTKLMTISSRSPRYGDEKQMLLLFCHLHPTLVLLSCQSFLSIWLPLSFNNNKKHRGIEYTCPQNDQEFNSALQAKTHLSMQFISASALSEVQLVIKLRANQAWGARKFQESA